MPLFGKNSPGKSPAPPSRPSYSVFESLGLRPMPRKEAGPQPKPSGLFGEKGGYRSFGQQREHARKAPFAPMPGTGRALGKEERVNLIKELEERAKKAGQSFGLSEQAFRERVLPQMKKEKAQLQAAGEINKANALQRKIDQYDRWIKGA